MLEAVQVSKPEPQPQPQPQPQPELKPEPKPSTIDTAFAKNWVAEQDGIYKDEFHISANGKATEKAVVQGEVFVDIEMDVFTDTSADPDHVMMTITKINAASADANVHVGDISYCLYQAGANSMKFECSEGNAYPTAFSADATDYVLQ